jgi:hypothetical protein
MPWVALPDSLQLCRISECLYTPFVRDQHLFMAPSWTVMDTTTSIAKGMKASPRGARLMTLPGILECWALLT